MPLHSDQNLYPGINPHLNSYVQNEPGGGWESFHSHHINHLVDLIDEQLPSGYLARSEKSLQISELAAPSDVQRSRTRPDITILKPHRYISGHLHSEASIATTPVATIPVISTLTEEDNLDSLVIYQVGEEGPLGRPITRIELLSPSNKPPGSHHEQYMHKRSETLRSGLRLVEIDYLHETPPVTLVLKSYPHQEEGAYPYTILVSDPRPTLEHGETQIYGFGVVDTIPIVAIPLAGADKLIFDFGAAYNYTYTRGKYYHLLVDYEQKPVHLERYTHADQEYVRQQMKTIQTQDA